MVDALSRRHHDFSSMIIGIDLREHILNHLPEDEFYEIFCYLVHSQRPLEGKFFDYSLDAKGLLQHKARICVPSTEDLREFIILEAHRAPCTTHPSVKKLHADLR